MATATDSAVAAPGAAALAATAANSSLYVGDLDREVTEAQLFDVFSQVSRPSIQGHGCRDVVSNRTANGLRLRLDASSVHIGCRSGGSELRCGLVRLSQQPSSHPLDNPNGKEVNAANSSLPALAAG
jgi:hypothetical protein